jgi:hypothetical protein
LIPWSGGLAYGRTGWCFAGGSADGVAECGERGRLSGRRQANTSDLLGQRRLTDEQGLGRAGEVKVLGDSDELPQIAQVHIHYYQWLSQQVLDVTGPLAHRDGHGSQIPGADNR